MGVTYYCSYCNYETDHKAKHNRHLTTLKHKISEHGIVCCGLTYYEKHKWVNHKKSVKHHQMTQDGEEVNPLTQLNTPKDPAIKITLNLSLLDKNDESGQAESGQAKSSQAESSQAKSGQAKSGQAE